jgi:CPA2 family monovalent cation:H+ antiporter-2
VSESVQLRDVLVILLAAVVVVTVFRRLRASAVLGYLVAGALIGPHSMGLVTDVRATAILGQFGLVFLLFSIGLELTVERLVALRRYVFGLGAAQVVVTTLIFWAALRALGLDRGAALIVGAGLALSSTAVVLQILVERRELGTPHGRVALAVLLLQDLAVVPLLTLVPLLARREASILSALGGAFLKAAAALIVILALGRLALRPMLRMVAKEGTPELFTGVVLFVVLGVGWLTEQVGLSMALGAFLAGLLMAETEYRPQVEGDIQPFRGLLLSLFFMTVGMGLNLELLREQWPLLVGLLVALLFVKATILLLLSRAFGLPLAVGAAIALMLAQGSEFGFVLFSLAQQSGAMSAHTTQVAVLVVGLSMAVTPGLLASSREVLRRLERPLDQPHDALVADTSQMNEHIVIAGFGRVGQTVGLLLDSRFIPYLALDLDPELVAEARRRGLPVFYGDASRADVLKAAGIDRAQMAVSTLDHPELARRAVQVLRRLRTSMPIIARAKDVAECERLVRAGATVAVPEIVEGSLQLGGVLLRQLGESPERVNQLLEQFRQETYARLAAITPAGSPAILVPAVPEEPGGQSEGGTGHGGVPQPKPTRLQ